MGTLNEAQARDLFSRFGIDGAEQTIVSDPAQAQAAALRYGSAVVLKILSSQIMHKSDVGGVCVGVAPEQVADCITRMQTEVHAKTGVRAEQFLVQQMVTSGIELILGFHRDALGSAILLGMGGVTAELLKDTTMRLLPEQGGLSLSQAYDMMHDLRTWPLLDGYRGRVKADQQALAQAIVNFSNMVASLGDKLIEAEINPLFVLPDGQGVKAADGIAILGD